MKTRSAPGLLESDDPVPVVAFNTGARSPFLIIGDHAGTAIPARLGLLGVAARDLTRHIASDIGVRGLGEALAQRLDATFIHQRYSRLVIDCNRDPGSADAIPAVSDGTIIPGNVGLSERERTARIGLIHAPYQDAIATELEARELRGQEAILISLHSFTPMLAVSAGAGGERPWHVGILYEGGNSEYARAVFEQLRLEPSLTVGDNEPYRMDATDYTVPRHAFPAGLPYVEFEVRQDLIGDLVGQRHWSDVLAEALRAVSRQTHRSLGGGS